MIEIKTRLTKDNFLSYSRWNGNKNAIFGFMAIAMIIIIPAVIRSSSILAESDLPMFIGIILFAVALGGVLGFLLLKMQRNMLAKKSPYCDKATNIFTFNADSFKCRTIMDNGVSAGELTVKYSSIKKVMEIKKYYFIKINSMQVFVVPKSDIKNEDVKEFRKLLNLKTA